MITFLFGSMRAPRSRRAACAALTIAFASGCASQASPPQSAANATAAGATPAPSNAGNPPAQLMPATNDPNRGLRYTGWVLVAVGAQSAAFAVATSFIMLHEHSVRADECNAQKICSAGGIDANGKLDSLGPWNAGAYILAAAGLGAGAYLVIANPPDQASTAVGVGPTGSGVGFNLRSRF